ncbi:hypothetical protein [Diaphorobacter ruginosibacter]|uniref:hypothetical protein n=1 Tax=Diaphorobacter ruginosibacter TaxID=1715720 RepID=UPI003341AF6B
MRRIFSMALVFMLVLRGLLGDAMAMGIMPAAALEPAEHAVMRHMEHPAHADPAMLHEQRHEAVADMPSSAHCMDGSSSARDCGGGKHHAATPCSACDICNSSLHLPARWELPAPQAPQSPHAEHSERFASALPAQVAKPPIS